MLLISNIFLLLVKAVTFRREFTILFHRVAIFILLYSRILGYVYITYLGIWIGIYNSLFHSKGSASAVITYYLLGCFSSGFILLRSGFLYADCGITSLYNWILFFSPESFENSTDLASILLSGIPARG
jgi:RsiW-degrading membrane proteinase PrsW (M82 family)